MLRPLPLLASLLAAAILCSCTTKTPTDKLREQGAFHFKRAEYPAAAGKYQQIVDRYPGDWQGQYYLGVCLTEMGQLVEARKALEVAHTRMPDDDDVAGALAEVMYQQGDVENLFAMLRNRARTTQLPSDYLRLARYSLEMNDPDSARLAVDTAIQLDEGQNVEPYLAASDLAERLGDLELAVKRLRQAYGIDPHDERVTERLKALGEVPGPTIALPPGR
jgi:tetratricopeptide (TPR) repeat protein